MTTKFSGRGTVKATLTVELADPATMKPGIIGAVLSRWLSGDVPEVKQQMYRAWVGQLIHQHRNRTAVVSPQGSHYVDAVAALLNREGNAGIHMVVAREMAERLCTGGLSIVKG